MFDFKFTIWHLQIHKFCFFFYPRANTFTHCWAAAFLSVTLWVESERLMHGANVRLASSHPEAQELKYCGWYNITSLHTKPDADCMWKMQSWLLWNSVEMGKSPRRRKVIYLEDILHVLRLERTRIQSLLFGWSQSMNYLNQRTWCSALFYQSLFRFLTIYTPTLQLKNNQQCIFSSQWRKLNIILNIIIMTKNAFLIADFNVDWGSVPLHNSNNVLP